LHNSGYEQKILRAALSRRSFRAVRLRFRRAAWNSLGARRAAGRGSRHERTAVLRRAGDFEREGVRDFWGDKVNPETKSKIGSFYENMLDSTYMDWLAEYDTNLVAVDGRQGTKQHIGRGTFNGAIEIQPTNGAASLTDENIQSELDGQIAARKLPPAGPNSLYMIYFPAGVSISIGKEKSCQSFCAYHEGFKSPRDGSPIYYGVMPCAAAWAAASAAPSTTT